MTGTRFDEENSRKVEAIYRTPDVVAQRTQVLKALQLADGESVLDIGCGPGLLAHDIAAGVGPAGRVCGIDASQAMLAMASKTCVGQQWTEFRAADASQSPYPDNSFDAAVSTQVYEYVQDIPAALEELHRVLRPGGRALILDTDYGSLVIHTEDTTRMARVLAAWEEHFAHSNLPRTLSRQLRDVGFTMRQRTAIPMFNPEFEDDTYGKGMLEMMARFVPGRKGVSQSEAEAWFAEFTLLGAEGRFFFSINRYLFLVEKLSAA